MNDLMSFNNDDGYGSPKVMLKLLFAKILKFEITNYVNNL